MGNRFKNTVYTIEDIKRVDGRLRYVRNEDDTLFSGCYKTKIKSEDLPEWYLRGRYYKRWGYMSTKGITDMVYIPNLVFNHFLKDDCLLIAYGGKIVKENPNEPFLLDRYSGYDERVYAVGGTNELWLNITYNYGVFYYRVIGEKGIRTIYGMSGAESIPLLEKAIASLGDDISADYWEATEGNAKRPLFQLLAMAKMRPDGVWDGD